MKIGLGVLSFVLILSWPGLATAADASCGDVVYRIWQGGSSSYYDYGTEIPLEVGPEAHLYLHVRSKSRSPYSASAEIGYPREILGQGPRAQEVLEYLRLKAQSTQDTAEGRIILSTKKAGRTTLGYRIREVKQPGSLNQVPRQCRTGAVQFKIGSGGTSTKPRPEPTPEPSDPALEAAEYLVTNLYSGLLRRSKDSKLPQEHIRVARERGHEGLRDLASDMLRSEEFRSNAFDRTVEAHDDLNDRSSDEAVLEKLMADMYRKLLGPNASLPQAEHESHLDALDICLSTFSQREAFCERLGQALVDHRLYRRYHGSRLEALNGATGATGKRWTGFEREVDERRQKN